MINFVHIPKTAGLSIKKACFENPFMPITYRNHRVDVVNIEQSMIILRNPVDRFISSVNYITDCSLGRKKIMPTFVSPSKLQRVKHLCLSGIATADDWVDQLRNKGRYYKTLKDIYKNNETTGRGSCSIGRVACENIFLFEPQSSWCESPRFILMFDRVRQEVEGLLSKLGSSIDLPHENKSPNKQRISTENYTWLEDFYAKDFELYYNYKAKTLDERIFI
jgi:hypothetical protein